MATAGTDEAPVVVNGWGGKRAGAGRKRAPGRTPIPYVHVRKRPPLPAGAAVYVAMYVIAEVGSLRRPEAYRAIRRALLNVMCRGLIRVVHVSIQRTHLQLLVEADDEHQLARGLQGLQISTARHLNVVLAAEQGRAQARRGPVFAARYHAEIIEAPARARRILDHLFNGWRHQGEHRAMPPDHRTLDPYATGLAFDGWRDHLTPFALPADLEPLPLARARTPLLTTAWRALGPLDPLATPDPL